MAFNEKQLAQVRENSTNAVSVYSPGVGITGIIRTVVLCNTSGAPVTYRLFQDDDGTTYDESTALFWDNPLDVDQTLQLDVYYPMNDSNGNFAYQSSVANAITITVSGAEVS